VHHLNIWVNQKLLVPNTVSHMKIMHQIVYGGEGVCKMRPYVPLWNNVGLRVLYSTVHTLTCCTISILNVLMYLLYDF